VTEPREFSFSGDSVAKAYDEVLVPVLFEPWATRLVENGVTWKGRHILDLATGTGVVAQLLAQRVGSKGRVIATDINSEMLSLARKRCSRVAPAVEFLQSPAHPLDLPDVAIDVVVCQQGFQFFPDRRAATKEVWRVLREGGEVITSTWCPVADCEFFGAICTALNALNEPEIADMMRLPFDFMSGSELTSHFESVGFIEVEIERQEQALIFGGGVKQAVEAVFSTPIAPKLRALPEPKQDAFRNAMSELLLELSHDGLTMGRMVSNMLSAEKPASGSRAGGSERDQ